jgi:hypothetical protein
MRSEEGILMRRRGKKSAMCGGKCNFKRRNGGEMCERTARKISVFLLLEVSCSRSQPIGQGCLRTGVEDQGVEAGVGSAIAPAEWRVIRGTPGRTHSGIPEKEISTGGCFSGEGGCDPVLLRECADVTTGLLWISAPGQAMGWAQSQKQENVI